MAEHLEAIGPPLDSDWEAWETLRQALGRAGRVMVAFSGGVDSTLLLYAARHWLGQDCLAVTAVSDSLASEDRHRARELARMIGAAHREIETGELELEQYRRNQPDRCYFCKRELFTRMSQLAQELGFTSLAYGAITDDLGDHRPGARAAREFQVLAPLCEAGLSKSAVRRLSRAVGLPTWSRPSQPCLSSRIAYGLEVLPGRLKMVEAAESLLRLHGLEQCRVRHHDRLARIEVPVDQLETLCRPGLRELLIEELRRLGFVYVTLDLAGLRSGSANEILPLRVVQ